MCVSLQLEAAGCDPLDELYDALAAVVGTEDTTECYKSYLLVLNDFNSAYQKVLQFVPNPNQSINKLVAFTLQPSGDAVSLLENVALISDGTTGLVTWEAALYLAEWALDHQQTFTNKSASLLDMTVLFRSQLKLISPLWLQDSSGAGQWHRTDRHHDLSLLQAQQIYLQRLSPWCPAET